jgi:hypothetical protein
MEGPEIMRVLAAIMLVFFLNGDVARATGDGCCAVAGRTGREVAVLLLNYLGRTNAVSLFP